MRSVSIKLCLLLICFPACGWALDVLVNQVGFEPISPKVFRVQRTTDYAGSGTFSVKRVSDGVQVSSGTLTRKGGLWDKWYWEGEFSSFTTSGDYYISATVGTESANSYNFNIGDNTLLNQTGTLTYQYFFTQRCGVAVPGWHTACHLDDGIRKDNNQHTDAVGGWHDAGDYGKYAHGFAADGVWALLWLYENERSYYDAIDTDSNGLADIVDEALHQARWLAKMVEPSGHVMSQTQMRRSGASWVKPQNDTNNVIGDYDDRWIDPGDENTPQETVVCASLIRMHKVLASKGLPTESFAAKALSIWNHRVALAVSQGGHNNLGNGAYHIFAGLDLYSVFGQQDCWDRSLQKIDEMTDGIITAPTFYDSSVFAEAPGYELGALAWFAVNYPSTTQAQKARTAVQALMARNIYLADDPIGLVRRDYDGTLDYFPTNPDWNGFFLGINRLYLLMTWGATEAYRLIGDPAYLRFAMDQYNWVMGANYNRVCMMEAAGDYNVPRYHTRLDTLSGHSDGAQPGCVPNGYIREYTSNLPKIDLTGNRYQSNEGWLINNAAYAMALAGMNVFRDNAQYVSDTIPATMNAGQSYQVSVTMRNTGTSSWTDSGGYKLGALENTDPFYTAGSRISLAPGDSIGSNQQKTFTFTMTAPLTPGTYTTDWQMVHNDVVWFGGKLVKQVQVVDFTPPGSVSNLSALAGSGQITLSWTNPPDPDFAGTMIRYKTTGYPTGPADGTLVVDKSGAPGAGDSFTHTGLVNGRVYYYSVFAHDAQPNYSTAATVIKSPVTISTISNSTFTSDANGWSFSTWMSGPYEPGAMSWNNAAGSTGGGMRCTGSGATDNDDRCNREGGEISRIISTAGYTGIRVSYDLRVNSLGMNNTGAGIGSCVVDHDLIDEQLTVFYSINSGSSWTEADWLKRSGLASYTTYGTRTIDLSGASGVSNNPNFMLRFRWQLNTASDTADLDSIRVLGYPTESNPPTTTATPAGGIYNKTKSVALSANEPATIRYTTDGTEPTSSSLFYMAPITVNSSKTVRFFAIDAAGNVEQSAGREDYTILANDGSIAQVKQAGNGFPVTLGGKALYLKQGSVGYIEEKDRFSGVRIEGVTSASEGDMVCLTGWMRTTPGGERYIQIDKITPDGPLAAAPLAANNRWLCSSIMDGLYVKCWGRVAAGSVTANSFVLTDGSDPAGVKIVTQDAPGVSEGDFVMITGAAGIDGSRVIYKK